MGESGTTLAMEERNPPCAHPHAHTHAHAHSPPAQPATNRHFPATAVLAADPDSALAKRIECCSAPLIVGLVPALLYALIADPRGWPYCHPDAARTAVDTVSSHCTDLHRLVMDVTRCFYDVINADPHNNIAPTDRSAAVIDVHSSDDAEDIDHDTDAPPPAPNTSGGLGAGSEATRSTPYDQDRRRRVDAAKSPATFARDFRLWHERDVQTLTGGSGAAAAQHGPLPLDGQANMVARLASAANSNRGAPFVVQLPPDLGIAFQGVQSANLTEHNRERPQSPGLLNVNGGHRLCDAHIGGVFFSFSWVPGHVLLALLANRDSLLTAAGFPSPTLKIWLGVVYDMMVQGGARVELLTDFYSPGAGGHALINGTRVVNGRQTFPVINNTDHTTHSHQEYIVPSDPLRRANAGRCFRRLAPHVIDSCDVWYVCSVQEFNASIRKAKTMASARGSSFLIANITQSVVDAGYGAGIRDINLGRHAAYYKITYRDDARRVHAIILGYCVSTSAGAPINNSVARISRLLHSFVAIHMVVFCGVGYDPDRHEATYVRTNGKNYFTDTHINDSLGIGNSLVCVLHEKGVYTPRNRHALMLILNAKHEEAKALVRETRTKQIKGARTASAHLNTSRSGGASSPTGQSKASPRVVFVLELKRPTSTRSGSPPPGEEDCWSPSGGGMETAHALANGFVQGQKKHMKFSFYLRVKRDNHGMSVTTFAQDVATGGKNTRLTSTNQLVKVIGGRPDPAGSYRLRVPKISLLSPDSTDPRDQAIFAELRANISTNKIRPEGTGLTAVFEARENKGRYATVAEGGSINIARPGVRRVDGHSETSGAALPPLIKEPTIKVKLLVRGKNGGNPPWTVREDTNQLKSPTGAPHAQAWAP